MPDEVFDDIEWIVSGWFQTTLELEDVESLTREIRDYIAAQFGK